VSNKEEKSAMVAETVQACGRYYAETLIIRNLTRSRRYKLFSFPLLCL